MLHDTDDAARASTAPRAASANACRVTLNCPATKDSANHRSDSIVGPLEGQASARFRGASNEIHSWHRSLNTTIASTPPIRRPIRFAYWSQRRPAAEPLSGEVAKVPTSERASVRHHHLPKRGGGRVRSVSSAAGPIPIYHCERSAPWMHPVSCSACAICASAYGTRLVTLETRAKWIIENLQ